MFVFDDNQLFDQVLKADKRVRFQVVSAINDFILRCFRDFLVLKSAPQTDVIWLSIPDGFGISDVLITHKVLILTSELVLSPSGGELVDVT